MKETGVINRSLAKLFSEQGHGDKLMVVDAGFAIPKGVEVVDLSLKENFPLVMDVLHVIQHHFSVEAVVMSQETKKHNPTFFNDVLKVFKTTQGAKEIEHLDLKRQAKDVKAIIRTGDFTAYANVLLVSGAGDRWYFEHDK